MIIRAIDFETTGIPSETDRHAIVKVGWCDLTVGNGQESTVGVPNAEVCDPGRPIPIESMAVHHIRDCHVSGRRQASVVLAGLIAGVDAFAAHRVDFEREFFDGGTRPWVCTHKSSLRVWPDAPSHSCQGLRYYFGLDDIGDFDRELAMPPHRAGPDAYVCCFILRALLDREPLDNLLRWSAGPALLVKVGFGKHRGKRWAEVDKSYLDWIIKSDITDRDVRATAKYHLKIACAKRSMESDHERYSNDADHS